MKLPTFGDLSDEQLVIYEHDPDEALFVLGPPGSGKTTMAIWRARFLATTPLDRTVTVITRNRLLCATASQMAQGDEDARPITIATMHSFASTQYSRKFGRNIPEPRAYVYDWNRVMADYAAAPSQPVVQHLILDEAQNLPVGFIRWAIQHAAEVVTVFADEDQTTLAERSSVLEIRAAGMPAPHRLTRNFRNSEEIATLMECFHRDGFLPPARVTQGRTGQLPVLLTITAWQQLVDAIVIRRANRSESIGVIVDSQAAVQLVAGLLRAALPGVRVDLYHSGLARHAVDAIMTRQPGVTVLTGESAIGLEFDAAYVQDIAQSLPPITPAQNRRLYMLCARAQKFLALVDGPAPLGAAQSSALPDENTLAR